LELVMLAERRDKVSQQTEEFKTAFRLTLVGNDPQRWVKVLYPEVIPEQEAHDDGSGIKAGEYHFTEEVDPEQVQQELEALMRQSSSGTLSAGDLEGWM
jgi:hypothetical protein